ncbi:hypothetical protein LCGC14_2505160 [marine sediment metagenome]|uniref:Uncharacterized protein n=1 Tax=marine sediment metagenome TaxID=412755 RepID=A0A0F9B0P3_9ZZZZ
MIEKQREKEFLFELERLYHNYNLIVVSGEDYIELKEADCSDIDTTTKVIEYHIDLLRRST